MTDRTHPDSGRIITSGDVIAELQDRIAELEAELEAVNAASPTHPAEQQATKETSGGFHVWRDISTAPKDGSRFVAIGYNYGLYSEGRHICVAQWFRGCWMETSDWNEASELQHLTHWLPLPSPPDDVAAPAEQQAAPKAAPGERCANCGDSKDLHNGLRCVNGKEKSYWKAPQQEAQEPYAYAVYFPDQPNVELVHDLDELIDDLTNRPHVVTKLYTAPRPAPDCHHRPPCDECAEFAAQGGK